MNRAAARLTGLLILALVLPACEDTTVINQILQPGATGSGGIGSFGGSVRPGVVFTCDRNQVGVPELWAADLGGTVLVNLSGPLAIGGSVAGFQWSPDRSRVAFLADKDLDEVAELYVVPAAGGTPLKVVPKPFTYQPPQMLAWSPDSSRILYRMVDVLGNQELRTVRFDGVGGEVALTGILPSTASLFVPTNSWSPDSARVAFLAGPDPASEELFTCPANVAGGFVKVSGTLPPGGLVGSFRWAPNGSRLAYVADQDVFDRFELYTTLPSSAASIVKISGTPVAGGDVEFDFEWAPDSSRVAYTADQDTNDLAELYTAPAATAGMSVKVSGPMVVPDEITGFGWAPNSSRIAFRLVPSSGQAEIHTTLPTAGPSLKVSGTPPVTSMGPGGFDWSPASDRVSYLNDETTADVVQVYTASASSAGTSIAVSEPSLFGNPILAQRPVWAPDGSRLAYVLDQDTSDVLELYTAPPAATGQSVKVSGAPPMPTWEAVLCFWTTDGSRIVYSLHEGFGTVRALYATHPVTGGAVLVSGPLLPGREIGEIDVR